MFFVKRVTVEAFYQLMNFLGAETVFNHADYRLMSKRALEGLAQFHEVNLFLRGIVPMMVTVLEPWNMSVENALP